jgi:hypothetical protein
MAANRAAVLAWLSGLAATIVTDADDLSDFSARAQVAGGLSSADFAAEALSLMQMIGESVATRADFFAIMPPATADAETVSATRILAAFGLALGAGRVVWRSRPEARAGRARLSATGDDGLAAASALGADGADLYGWLSAVIAVSVRLISEIAASATPMVRVETGLSLPSTLLAHRLYGDASRAGELVDGSGSDTPILMPTRFEALAE